MLVSLCGEDVSGPATYLSSTNIATIRFRTDGSVTNFGFLAAVKVGESVKIPFVHHFLISYDILTRRRGIKHQQWMQLEVQKGNVIFSIFL